MKYDKSVKNIVTAVMLTVFPLLSCTEDAMDKVNENDNFKFNQEQISLLDKNIELGVNFPFNELCDAVITLNNYGIKNYNKRYLHRPKVEKIVGNDYYFNCSIDQLYFYFIAFGDTFVVKKPVELAKRFYNKFKKAKNNFYNEYQKNIE